eukprot:TRINITY_DN8181_c0_g1_i1.p1 TRINITY_DN8181_c0_g1~~TRINITY_DN8181_c0_g1_i1.p1  ORF type:complete len:625 (-),score=94.06 TRINITY_DN8181_c0_g1_i1:47-1921(-)
MKFLLLLLIVGVNLRFGNTYCVSSIFTFGGKASCMENLPSVDCVHSFLQGEHFEGSCADQELEVGTCCISGATFCEPTTYELCTLIMKGTWSQDLNCSECPVYHSCCLNQTCTEELDEEQCIENNGVYMDFPCASGKCLIQEQFHGACCSIDECYNIPQVFCPEYVTDTTWTKGKNCSESGCPNSFVDVFNPPVNTSSPGRCCHFDSFQNCFETEYTEDQCNERGDLWEPGLGCDSRFTFCYQRGSCYKDGLCIGQFTKIMCDIYGGAYSNGGICNVLPTSACFTEGDRCNVYDSIQCEILGGFYDNNTEECPINPGACCTDMGCVEHDYSSDCNYITFNWIPNATCDGDICSIEDDTVACCFNDFCITSPVENFCKTISIQNNIDYDLFEKPTCPRSGTCNSVIIVDSEVVNVDFIGKISVSNISLNIQNNASIEFDDFKIDGSAVFISNSNFLANGTFEISNSTMDIYYQLGNNIIIGDCLTGDNSTSINIDLDPSQVSNTSDWKLDIIHYGCLKGSINLVVTIEGFYSECYQATPGISSIFVTYTDICVQDIEETTNSYTNTNTQKEGIKLNRTTGIVITIVGAVIVVIACMLFVFYYKWNSHRAMKALMPIVYPSSNESE